MIKFLILFMLSMNVGWSFDFNDSHFHLTNYIQEGTDIKKFLEIMGDKVGRSTLFGIPLQQQWSERNSGNVAPTYYLQTDANLYYYSFTDAHIAMSYNSLNEEQKKRFDPMITGFNPTDMYAVDHIKRVLKTFPGVFVGIGEFTIHKEFVSSKIAGEIASLQDKALDRILEFAAESGLQVVIHSDIHAPFPKKTDKPVYLTQIMALFKRHPKTNIIWAHTGLGRVVEPIGNHAENLLKILQDSDFKHVNFDISWDEVAKYVVATPESLKKSLALFEKYPDRFLFGTDEVAPDSQEKYLKVFHQYEPIWNSLSKETGEKIKIKNYERIFDQARRRVRAWEKNQ
jgi:predicted TIM-barrel fold metal-dependent hydrolase